MSKTTGKYIPEQGDIITLDFCPQTGKEINKVRPALVISQKLFNEVTGFAIVAPITSTNYGIKMQVMLPEDCEVSGGVLVYQLRSLDYVERQAKFICRAPSEVVERVCKMAATCVRFA